MPNHQYRRFSVTAVYRAAAYIVLNTLLLLLALNLILAAYLLLRRPHVLPAVAARHEYFDDPRAYTRISRADFVRLMREQILYEGLQYAPWVQFVSVPFRGHLFNVDGHGFRKTTPPPRPSIAALRVAVFGGSTTFGFGVPDDYTIPSYLQRVLEKAHPEEPVLVKNMGQPYYYSSQELALLTVLIRGGEAPDAAVFLDGLNDTLLLSRQTDEPYFTPKVRELWHSKAHPAPARALEAFEWLPMVRLAEEWSPRRSTPEPLPASARIDDDGRTFTPEETGRISDYIVSRYTANVRMLDGLCQAYRIHCLFVWQPCPFYKYDRTLHRRFPYPEHIPAYWPQVYTRMSEFSHPQFLFLGGLFEDKKERVYVDDVHYNESASELIASRIAAKLPLGRNDP